MKHTPPSSSALRVADLPQNSATPFTLRPDNPRLKEIAEMLDLLALRKLSFSGDVSAMGAADWQLAGTLGATVVQPCAVTLQPVTTRIDVPVRRVYQRDLVDIDAPEAEMPQDDEIEVLTAWIDPGQVMVEALDLALPMYPRAEGVNLGRIAVSEPGVAPMTDDDAKPFAGLAALKSKLSDPDEPTQ